MDQFIDERKVPRTAGPLIEARSSGIKVFVEKHVWEKINGWCNAAMTEVSGMFCVKPHPEGFMAYEAFLPEQRGSSGYTIFDSQAYNRMKFYVYNKYGVDAMVDLCRGWWHTHPDFDPFWSGTDDATAQQHMFDSADGWAVSIVVNKKGVGSTARFSLESGANYRARADIMVPARITADDLPVIVVPNSRKVRKKRNYRWDIKRWVSPYVPKVSSVPRYVIVKKDEKEEDIYVNYGGRLVKEDTLYAILAGFVDPECFCGDNTCIDCSTGQKDYEQLKGGANNAV